MEPVMSLGTLAPHELERIRSRTWGRHYKELARYLGAMCWIE